MAGLLGIRPCRDVLRVRVKARLLGPLRGSEILATGVPLRWQHAR